MVILQMASQPAITVLQNEALIIEIDNIDNMKMEQLNKSNPTTDIKEFFVATPHILGQDKPCMSCKLCK
jgi:hypothetical protein